MARRVRMVQGRGNKSDHNYRLGLVDRYSATKAIEGAIVFPKSCLEEVEERCGVAIPPDSKEEIAKEFEDLIMLQLIEFLPETSHDASMVFGFGDLDRMRKSEFEKLVARLKNRAEKLREAVDELVAFDTDLAFPPHDTRDRDEWDSSRLRGLVESLTLSWKPRFGATEHDLIDYFTFRKTLDYFERFEEKNRRFNNNYSARWTEETDHGLFELLVRRVVIELRRSKFPISRTVPTDVSPDYEAPFISVLLAIQNSWNAALDPFRTQFTSSFPDYDYRRMLYLSTQVLEDLESWDEALALFRWYDRF